MKEWLTTQEELRLRGEKRNRPNMKWVRLWFTIQTPTAHGFQHYQK